MSNKSFLFLLIISILILSGCFIKGRVVDETGAGVAFVTVNLRGNSFWTTTTDGDGYYQFGTANYMLSDGSYIVTPSKSECIFIPVNKNIYLAGHTYDELGDVVSPVSGTDFNAFCNWEVYDNFDSGYFDLDLWHIDDRAGIISIENGKAKFKHIAGTPRGNCNLWLKDRPETIKAVIAEISIISYSGDAYSRLLGWLGKKENNNILNQLWIMPFNRLIHCSVVELDSSSNFAREILNDTIVYNLDLESGKYVIGSSFYRFRDQNLEGFWFAEDLGSGTFSLQDVSPPTQPFLIAFGTYSNTGNGTCEVCLDNVKVLR